jgi:hypothetical protein
MADHTAAVASHAGLALTVALMKHLAQKGVLKDEDGTFILNAAIQSVSGHEDEHAIAAVIKNLTQPKKRER